MKRYPLIVVTAPESLTNLVAEGKLKDSYTLIALSLKMLKNL